MEREKRVEDKWKNSTHFWSFQRGKEDTWLSTRAFHTGICSVFKVAAEPLWSPCFTRGVYILAPYEGHVYPHRKAQVFHASLSRQSHSCQLGCSSRPQSDIPTRALPPTHQGWWTVPSSFRLVCNIQRVVNVAHPSPWKCHICWNAEVGVRRVAIIMHTVLIF